MSQFLYEKSVSYKGHLIIPFILGIVESQSIYSYTLLSELGRKGQFHKLENPANICSSSISNIIEVAKKHLDVHSDVVSTVDYFNCRYTYRQNLIIIHPEGGKCFYDHYPPESLNNIAAPKLFLTEKDCINWVRQGLERNYISRVTQ